MNQTEIEELIKNSPGCTVYIPTRRRLNCKTIAEEREKGATVRELAKKYGVSERTIYNQLKKSQKISD